MAGDWIAMRVDLAGDPAVVSIAAKLDLQRPTVVGHIHAVWSWADQHLLDGHAPRCPLSFIDSLTCGGFGLAMCDAGWLIFDDTGITIPKFELYNGKNGKKRLQAAKRQKDKRSRDGHASSVTGSSVLSSSGSSSKKTETSKEPPSARRSPKVSLPADFDLTDDLREYALEQLGVRLDVLALFTQFTEHHRAKDSRFADWNAAWRTWVQNAKQYGFPKIGDAKGVLGAAAAKTADAGARWAGGQGAPPAAAALRNSREPGED